MTSQEQDKPHLSLIIPGSTSNENLLSYKLYDGENISNSNTSENVAHSPNLVEMISVASGGANDSEFHKWFLMQLEKMKRYLFPDIEDSKIMEKQLAIGWFFIYNGAIFGFYAAIIPNLKKLHGLSNVIFGLVLLAAVGGAILSMPLVIHLNKKIGSAKSSVVGAIVTTILLPLLGIDGPIWLLIIGLVCLGFGVSWFSTSKNAQAVLLEKVIKKPRMGSFQCVYAIGGVCGALIGGGLSSSKLSLFDDFLIYSPTILMPCLLAYFSFFTHEEEILINKLTTVDSSSDLNLDYDKNSPTSPSKRKIQANLTINPLNEPFASNTEDVSIDEIIPNSPHTQDSLRLTVFSPKTQVDQNKIEAVVSNEPIASSQKILISLCCLGILAYMCDGSIGKNL